MKITDQYLLYYMTISQLYHKLFSLAEKCQPARQDDEKASDADEQSSPDVHQKERGDLKLEVIALCHI